jgi:hypothetical protein
MLRTGRTDGSEESFHLVSFTTILQRAVNGVSIPDSFAWATFNENDEVVSEQVWWPELPASARSEIAGFQAILQDASAAAVFKSKLPSDLQGEQGTLALHHGPPTVVAPYASVTLDFTKRGNPNVRHLDKSGADVQFGSAAPVLPGPSLAVPSAGSASGGGRGDGTGGGGGSGSGR